MNLVKVNLLKMMMTIIVVKKQLIANSTGDVCNKGVTMHKAKNYQWRKCLLHSGNSNFTGEF